VYDAESHNFHEFGRLATILSSIEENCHIDPIPASEAGRFLESRQLDLSLPVFVVYIYFEVNVFFWSRFHIL